MAVPPVGCGDGASDTREVTSLVSFSSSDAATVAMDGAQSAGAQVPMGERARELYDKFCNDGFAGKDFSAMFTYLNR